MVNLKEAYIAGLTALALAGNCCASQKGIEYKIEKGDTFFSLASRYGTSVKELINANQGVDPRALQIGQVVYIPELNEATQVKTETSQESYTQLILKRHTFSDVSTIGTLYADRNKNGFVDEGDERLCYTLELPYNGNRPNESSIPTGDYLLRRRNSPRFGEHFEVQVSGRDKILIHAGNYPKNTSGCILPGETAGKDFVGSSAKALDSLRRRISGKVMFKVVNEN